MSFVDFLIGGVALTALLLPGWMAAKAARLPQPWLAGFIFSAVVMVNLILVLEVAGVALNFLSVGSGWLAVTLLVAMMRRGAQRAARPVTAPRHETGGGRAALLWIVLVPAVAVVIYRAVTQPLFGIDTVFRWNYLAQQMLSHHSLGFYPPVTAADYEIYGWPDGIAPAVSSLYFWLYALAGAARSSLTAPLVIFQYGLLIGVTFGLARRMFSERAAVFSCALVAGSPVIGWATAMGQETGLMALSLAALFFYLPRDREETTTSALVIAGLSAGLGALAREYGLTFIALGAGLMIVRRLSRRSVGIFLVVALLAALPWYGRNWLRTGNPFFNLDLAGWFPVNGVQAWMNDSYQVEYSASHLPTAAWRFLAVNGAMGIFGLTAGAIIFFRKGRELLAAIGLVIVLWFVSLGYTAAGFTTAIRVLSPALVLAAVLGGGVLARWVPGRRHLAAAGLALGLLALDASLRALTLPGTVYRIPPSEWLSVGRAVHDYHDRPVYREIARAVKSERILVLGPNSQLTLQGARTVPLWSPEVAFLFDPKLTAPEAGARLRAIGIGYIMLNGGVVNERFLAHSPYFRDPGTTLRPRRIGDEVVLEIVAP